jgi:hypothetical protein
MMSPAENVSFCSAQAQTHSGGSTLLSSQNSKSSPTSAKYPFPEPASPSHQNRNAPW